ncbi:MAG: hypothetical protein GY853_00650 [PVC group bacterium]|nr:hypothetical protein [PVC group bacterium]
MNVEEAENMIDVLEKRAINRFIEYNCDWSEIIDALPKEAYDMYYKLVSYMNGEEWVD